ncbi:hypothetical protein BUALT_Bualt08G0052500 [Buddleja alternifolia]|uniref:DUF8040 domain-containing protein n=1 Tax=Buddleja alternifolia TaxID=168488 RepID=A0AAV6XEX0_9LAMI|nr:hypothetical protein BUALT_Bualt08G0052500 [Buddleja alternifolia]
MSLQLKRKAEIFLLISEIMHQNMFILNMFVRHMHNNGGRRWETEKLIRYVMAHRIPKQIEHLECLIELNDVDCIDNLRMSRVAFARLCYLLEHIGGLVNSRYVTMKEKVALFLSILAHHKKIRIVCFDFKQSGQPVSNHFHAVLNAVSRLHTLLLVTPRPIGDDCTNPRWKWFKGCIGALDGTYIKVKVNESDKPRNRTRKGDIVVNVLIACDMDQKCTYLLSGWEGSAADSRVLRDALNRQNKLKVPQEMLVDPLEHCLDDTNSDDEDNDIDLIDTIEPSQAWTNFRDNLASSMFNEWRDVAQSTYEPTSSKVYRGGPKKGVSTRRSWSQREEEVLISAFKDIIAQGWKADNGFKTGYLQELEHYMKKNCGSLSSMLSKSGIGWNDTTKMVEANDDAWDGYVKDRATGEQDEDFVEAVNHVLNDTNHRDKDTNHRDKDVLDGLETINEGFEGKTETMSICQPMSSVSAKKKAGKKRKSAESQEPMYELLGNYYKSTDLRLGKIAKRIGYDYDMSMERKEVYGVVAKIEGLSIQQRLFVADNLVKNSEDLDLLFSLPDCEKVEYVRMKLVGNL